MYKDDLALNTLQWLICYKTKSNQTKPNLKYFLAHSSIEFEYFFYTYLFDSYRYLTGTTTPGPNGSGSNCIEEVLLTLQSSKLIYNINV